MKKSTFTDEDKNRIRLAIEHSETVCSGEIVPYYAKESDGYFSTSWKAACLSTIFALIVLVIIDELLIRNSYHEVFNPVWIAVISTTCAIAAFIKTRVFRFVIRALTSGNVMAFKVRKAAEAAFFEEGLHLTPEHNTILIYFSELEQRIEIVADKGISDKVSQAEWNDVLKSIVHEMRNSGKTSSIIRSVEVCSELLRSKGFTSDGKRNNSLSDELRGDA